MPVLVAAMALLFTAWLSADGVPASEPQQLNENESLLTITETVEAPLQPAPKGGDDGKEGKDDKPGKPGKEGKGEGRSEGSGPGGSSGIVPAGGPRAH